MAHISESNTPRDLEVSPRIRCSCERAASPIGSSKSRCPAFTVATETEIGFGDALPSCRLDATDLGLLGRLTSISYYRTIAGLAIWSGEKANPQTPGGKRVGR